MVLLGQLCERRPLLRGKSIVHLLQRRDDYSGEVLHVLRPRVRGRLDSFRIEIVRGERRQ
jgi:hypothetical protein